MKNLRVLVIDDDPITCKLIETILQMENYETVSVNHIDNQGIIPLLKKNSPHILILDFHLGSTRETLTFTAAIRANKEWQQLPILMTSAIDRRQACLEAGANDFIIKPFDWKEMTKRVNKLRDDLIYQEV